MVIAVLIASGCDYVSEYPGTAELPRGNCGAAIPIVTTLVNGQVSISERLRLIRPGKAPMSFQSH
jgi:hypothetical protein